MKFLHLSILFDHPVGDLWVVQEHLLLPHLLDSLVCVALQGVVVLVDLDAEAANSGEVVRLGQVTQAVVLHRLTSKKSQSTRSVTHHAPRD